MKLVVLTIDSVVEGQLALTPIWPNLNAAFEHTGIGATAANKTVSDVVIRLTALLNISSKLRCR